MTIFWQRWLTIWCAGIGIFGIVLYGAGYAATTAPVAALFDAFGSPFPTDPDRHLRFTTSLMGAVTFGWAVTYYAAFRAAWQLERAACSGIWRILTTGAVLWYAIDSVASVANGFPLNAVSNTIFLTAFLIPVIASRALSAHVASHGAGRGN